MIILLKLIRYIYVPNPNTGHVIILGLLECTCTCIFYEKTRGQVSLGILLGIQNIQAKETYYS